ncbi:MAG: hypothetical protein H6733_06215 [Alphaproteobacteria bacterium]|nr:hypothetical protein [Alphaproteobacteria bacterium]
MKLSRWLLHGVLGMSAATVATAPTTPAEAAKPGSDVVDDVAPGEAAIFGRYADLDAEATRARLDGLMVSRAGSYAVTTLSAQLADPTIVAAQIERTLLPLIAGAEVEAVDATLAAIMLDHYLSQVRPALLSGDLGVAETMRLLEARDALLTTAAYGSSPIGRQITRR